jgi:F-type H+-transporting ATPase subunit b
MMVELNGWFFVQLANFLILVYVLNVLLFGPVLRIFKERRRITDEAVGEVNALTARKEKILATLNEDLAKAGEQAGAIYTKNREEGLALQKELLKKAQDEAAAKLASAMSEIASESARARTTLRANIDKYSDEIVGKLIG